MLTWLRRLLGIPSPSRLRIVGVPVAPTLAEVQRRVDETQRAAHGIVAR